MKFDLIKEYKLILSTLSLLILIISGCSNLDISRNNSDFFESAMEAQGNELALESTPISERIAQIIGNSSSEDLNKNITFELALEQFSIMPLLSVDKVGGIIITDWYSTPSNSNERMKFNIIIKDEKIINESIDIFMFKEIYNGNTWMPSDSNLDTSNKIKELILKKANRLKATSELS